MSQFKFQKKVETNNKNHNCEQDFDLVGIPELDGTNTTTDESEGAAAVDHNVTSESNSQVISEDNEPVNPIVNEGTTSPTTKTPTTEQ